jgi:fused signal recognition particle receptor
MTIVYALLVVVALAAVYFLFFRKKGEQQLQQAPETKPLPAAGPTPKKEVKAEAPVAPPKPPKPPESARRPDKIDVIEEVPVAAAAPKATRKKPADVAGLRKGLAQARGGFIAKLFSIFSGKKEIDPNLLTELEETMLSSDVGVKTTTAILERLREGLEKNELKDGAAVWAALRAEATRILSGAGDLGPIRDAGKPTVVLMVGVNGVGKTTTIGKLATKLKADGKKVMLAAGDTFRAAAVQQLEVWGKRVEAEVVRGKEGADPGSVAFEATTKAKEQGVDVLLVDTAGRLHTKLPLMDEIKKVRKTIDKALGGAPHETFLILDATTGQNALTQASMFKDAVDLTGIVLTKLDGTAKGGIVLGICDELKVPVRYIGLGERAEDLREFDAEAFVEALFGDAEGEARAA